MLSGSLTHVVLGKLTGCHRSDCQNCKNELDTQRPRLRQLFRAGYSLLEHPKAGQQQKTQDVCCCHSRSML